MTPKEFEEKVLPSLKPIFLVREPMQNLLTLLEKIELLHQKASGAVFKEDIMPLVYCALEPKNPPSVQEKALKTVPGIMEALDYTTVKASLFPRISVSEVLSCSKISSAVHDEGWQCNANQCLISLDAVLANYHPERQGQHPVVLSHHNEDP